MRCTYELARIHANVGLPVVQDARWVDAQIRILRLRHRIAHRQGRHATSCTVFVPGDAIMMGLAK